MIDFIAAISNKQEAKKDYEKYRWFFTSSGKLVMGGKSAEQNEDIMERVQEDDIIMHTSSPGSPFCVIKNPSQKDIEECAIFTACFSHEWKRSKQKAEVHIFRASQIMKNSSMKTGTFGVLGSVERKKVELRLVLDIQKGKLRSVPYSAAKKKIAILTPGNLDKTTATEEILKILKGKYNYPATREEVMSAIPSDNISIKQR